LSSSSEITVGWPGASSSAATQKLTSNILALDGNHQDLHDGAMALKSSFSLAVELSPDLVVLCCSSMAERLTYQVYLVGEVRGAPIDWDREVQPSATERQLMADWGGGECFYRLDAPWNGHPQNALVLYDGQSVLLIADVAFES
jgi:hypothetical protein